MAVTESNFVNEITSKQNIDRIIDDIINEQYAENMRELSTVCKEYLNTSCSTLDESINVMCNYSSQIERETLDQIRTLCDKINENCNTIDEGETKLCSLYGENSDVCRIIKQQKEYISGLKNICMQLNDIKNKLNEEKSKIYNTEIIPGVSIKKINLLSTNLFNIGLLSLLIGFLMIYLSKGNILSSLKVVFSLTIVTGLLYIFIGEYGDKLVFSSLPENINLPITLSNYINEILLHQTSIGINLLIIGIIGFSFVYIVSIKKS
jgi:hypothetical protein